MRPSQVRPLAAICSSRPSELGFGCHLVLDFLTGLLSPNERGVSWCCGAAKGDGLPPTGLFRGCCATAGAGPVQKWSSTILSSQKEDENFDERCCASRHWTEQISSPFEPIPPFGHEAQQLLQCLDIDNSLDKILVIVTCQLRHST